MAAIPNFESHNKTHSEICTFLRTTCWEYFKDLEYMESPVYLAELSKMGFNVENRKIRMLPERQERRRLIREALADFLNKKPKDLDDLMETIEQNMTYMFSKV